MGVFHQRSFCSMVRGLLPVLGLCIYVFCPTLGILFLWCVGFVTLPMADLYNFHFDGNKFHFGMLDRKQLSYIRDVKPVIGEPLHLCKEGIVLADGRTVACDLILCATGY